MSHEYKDILKKEVKEFSDKDLADILEYCVINCFGLKQYMTERVVTYEEALMQIYIPDLLRRLRGQEETDEQFHSLDQMVLRIQRMKR